MATVSLTICRRQKRVRTDTFLHRNNTKQNNKKQNNNQKITRSEEIENKERSRGGNKRAIVDVKGNRAGIVWRMIWEQSRRQYYPFLRHIDWQPGLREIPYCSWVVLYGGMRAGRAPRRRFIYENLFFDRLCRRNIKRIRQRVNVYANMRNV